MKICSVNIGERKQISYNGKLVETGIFKFPVNKAVKIESTRLDGDNIVDLKYHGGVDQAVYGYAKEHYAYWKEKYPNLKWQYGMFGENLTISKLEELEIHVGNQYSIGDVLLEVTKPREPCMKLGLRFGTQAVLKEFWLSTKSGIYFKVLETGSVKAGDTVELIKSCPNNPTIAAVYKSKREK